MPERSDAFIIIIIRPNNKSRHASSSMVGNGLRSRNLFGDLIVFLTSPIVAGVNEARKTFNRLTFNRLTFS